MHPHPDGKKECISDFHFGFKPLLAFLRPIRSHSGCHIKWSRCKCSMSPVLIFVSYPAAFFVLILSISSMLHWRLPLPLVLRIGVNADSFLYSFSQWQLNCGVLGPIEVLICSSAFLIFPKEISEAFFQRNFVKIVLKDLIEKAFLTCSGKVRGRCVWMWLILEGPGISPLEYIVIWLHGGGGHRVFGSIESCSSAFFQKRFHFSQEISRRPSSEIWSEFQKPFPAGSGIEW